MASTRPMTVQESKVSNEENPLRDQVKNLITSKIQSINMRIMASQASEDDYSTHLLLLQMSETLSKKNEADLLADLFFLQSEQEQNVASYDREEKKPPQLQRQPTPVPINENASTSSANPVAPSQEVQEKSSLLRQVRQLIPRLSLLLHPDEEAYAIYIKQETVRAKQLSTNDLKNYISELNQKIYLIKSKRSETEEKQKAALKQGMIKLAEALVFKLTNLQQKNTQEQELFRDEQLMLLNIVSEELPSLKEFIEGLRFQISQLQPQTLGISSAATEYKEEKVTNPNNMPLNSNETLSLEHSPTGVRRSFSFIPSSQNISTENSSPNLSPRSSTSSSSPLSETRIRFPFVASFSVSSSGESSTTKNLTDETRPHSSPSLRRGSEPG